MVWPCCCSDLLNLKKIIIMPAMCHLLAQLRSFVTSVAFLLYVEKYNKDV